MAERMDNAGSVDKWKSAWEPIREDSIVYDYFASIEILNVRQTLQKAYFIIPESCREQKNNTLVKQKMGEILDTVKRDNPEEKLDDFLDKTIDLVDLIKYQHTLLSNFAFSKQIKWLSGFEEVWIWLAFGFAAFVNIVLLLTYDESDRLRDWYYGGSKAEGFDWIIFIRVLGCIQLLFAVLFVGNYAVGTLPVMMVQIDKRVQAVMNPSSEEDMEDWSYKIASKSPPFLIRSWFILTDPWIPYHLAYVVFAVLGVIFSPFFFVFHLADVIFRVTLLRYVLKSVTNNWTQIGATAFLGVLVLYVYSIIGFLIYHNDYEFGDGSIDCSTLVKCWAGMIDYGLRGPPVWTQEALDSNVRDFGTYIYNISYNLFVILILVAIITGIIIDTFAELRTRSNFVQDDTLNRCFICHLPREAFERQNVKFQKHLAREHFLWNYVYYSMYLDLKPRTDYTSTESYVRHLLDISKIDFFPIKKALSLSDSLEENEFKRLNTAIEDLTGQLSTLREQMNGQASTLQSQVAGQLSGVRDDVKQLSSFIQSRERAVENDPSVAPRDVKRN
eukprot:GILK01004673.1.p1 GENE.GILK01004673.1~~GILK01004673.1.p1  ORF type:complete len:644 (+),score=134.95 GILK01004673.1:264-1934(+)